jgi:O-antigen/teichoic acid export membrane protein
MSRDVDPSDGGRRPIEAGCGRRAQNLTQRAAGAAWWSALEIAARYGVQFVVMIVLARLLTPEDFGLIAMLVVFTGIGALLIDSGFGTALIQRQLSSDDDETTVFLFTTCASIVVAGVLWVAAPAIADFYKQPTLVSLTRFLASVLPLGAVGAVPDALLTMKLNFKDRTKAEVVASLCSGAVAVILAWRGLGAWSLAWQAVISIGLRAALLWLYSGWRPRGRFSWASFQGLFGFGSYMLLSGLLDALSTRLQSLLIGKLFDSRALGYYTLAQNTQQAPASFMGSVLGRVGLPVFATVADQRQKLLGALRLSLRIATFLFVPCMLGMAVVAKPLVILLYGSRWTPAAPILAILAVSASFWPLHVLNLAAVNAQGRSDLFFRLAVIKKVTAIGLIILASPGGPIAIAWAVLAASVFSVAVNTHYSKKLLDYGMLAQLADQIGTAALSLLAALAGWLVLHNSAVGPTAMVLAIALAASVYLGGAMLFRHPAIFELLSLFRALRTRGLVPPELPSES